MTLIHVATDGAARYANDVGGKDAIIRDRKPGDLLLLAWTGKYKTDIFLLTEQNIKDFYSKK